MPLPPGIPDPATVFGAVGTPMVFPTPDAPGGVQATHPSVVIWEAAPFGYRYWCTITPYPGSDDSTEDPWIFCSVDGVNWVSIPANPIDDQPGTVGGAYNSDVDLQLVDGVLYLFWRTVNTVGLVETLYYSTSTDGFAWTAKRAFYSAPQSVTRLVSPCLEWNGINWTMWAVDINLPTHAIVRLIGGDAPEDPWSAPVACTAPLPAGREAWHLGIEAVDGGYVALITDIPVGTTGGNGSLVFAASTDGLVWETGDGTCIPQTAPSLYNALYRASLVSTKNDGVDGWWTLYSAWIQETATWGIYSTWIGPPASTEELPAGPGPVATDYITWYACDLLTGAKIAKLPLLTAKPKWALGMYTSVTAKLPVPTTGPGHLEGINPAILQPFRTLFVCVVNEVPAWGGILVKPRGGSAAVAELALVSVEGYLLHRYVRAHDLTGLDEAEIARILLGDANDIEGINLVIDAPDTGTPRDRKYADNEDARVYQRLTELADLEDGFDWRIDLEWTTDRKTHVRKVFRLRKRLGRTQPAVVLSTKSKAYVRYDWANDHSEGRGANDILAYSSGQGSVRPQSDHMRDEVALASGIPRVEYRFQPSSSITDRDVLNSHARRALGEMSGGTKSIEVQCRANQAPARFGIDWVVGDAIALDLWGYLDPYGRLAEGRVVAAELDPEKGIITPTLVLEAW
jgi:hypothetical protein